jgi:hypothetical protein
MSCDLLEQLQTIPDPRRVTRNRKHLLGDVLLSGSCGVLADCNNFVEIAEWARHHEDFLRTFLELPNGIPTHDTYNRILAVVRPEALQAILSPWLQQRRGVAGDWGHIGGKTMRGTRHARQGLGALHLVSVRVLTRVPARDAGGRRGKKRRGDPSAPLAILWGDDRHETAG